MKKKILIVDDETSILEILQYNLQKEGFTVIPFSCPYKVLDYLQFNIPDLILADWMMPGIDGLELCKLVKMNSRTRNIPFIMITCRSEEIDVVTALELGAEDYLIKPIRIKELVSRIKKATKKHSSKLDEFLESSTPLGNQVNDKIIVRDKITINNENYEVEIGHRVVNLTASEHRLLALLARKPGKVFTRDEIIQHLNGGDYYVTPRAVDVQVVGLRKKLGECKNFIETIRSIGYRFKEI